MWGVCAGWGTGSEHSFVVPGKSTVTDTGMVKGAKSGEK